MPLPLPPKFERAIEKSHSYIFAYLEIDAIGVSDEASSLAEWEAKITGSSDVDYNASGGSPPPADGDVILIPTASELTTDPVYPKADHTNEWESGDFDDVNAPESDANYVRDDQLADGAKIYLGVLETIDIPRYATIKEFVITVRARENAGDDGWDVGYRYAGTNYWTSKSSPGGSFADYTVTVSVNPVTSNAWLVEELLQIEGIGARSGELHEIDISVVKLEVTYYEFDLQGGFTVELDLSGANTNNPATVSIDDLVPTGTSVVYSVVGSTTGDFAGEEVSLGDVEDGSEIDAYEYYQVTATLSSDGSDTPVVKSIRIDIPERIYKFSTLNTDLLDAIPSIQSIPQRTIKLDLENLITTTSSVSIALNREEEVDEMLRSTFVKGLDVRLYLGALERPNDSISRSDLLRYYIGKIEDFSQTADSVTFDLADVSIDLDAKWPVGSAPSTAAAATKDGVHMVQVIRDIYEDIGIASRYVDYASLDTLEQNVGNGTPPAPAFVVKRTGATGISEPLPAKDYLRELLFMLGAFAFTDERGKLVTIEYDPTTAAIDTWGDDEIGKGYKYSGGLVSYKNVCQIYFDWDGSGNNASDYSTVRISLDEDGIAAGRPVRTKTVKSKWIAGDVDDGYYGAEIALYRSALEVARLKDGLGGLPCSTGLDKCFIQVGDFIAIDTDDIDGIVNTDVGRGDVRNFIVTQKTWNPDRHEMEWRLTEVMES